MKVLYLINLAGKAGTEKYVENLMGYLHPNRCACGLCYNLEGPLSEKIAAAGMPVHRVVMRNPLDLKAAKELAKLCREEGYDVIHAQYPRENCIAILSRLFGNKAKVVFTSHLTIHQPLPWRVLNRIFTPKNQRVIAVCKEGEGFLLGNGVKKEKIQVIFNGIDAGKMPPRDRSVLGEFGIDKELVLSILTRFDPEKGLDFLCDSIRRLKDSTQVPFKVLVMGDGQGFPQIKARVEELGLSDTMILTGFRRDTDKLLAASDIYLNTSSCNEAMSFAILEALANHLPVVATDVGGNSDLVHLGGTCGYILNYGDVDGFAGRLKELLEDEGLRQKFGQTALEKAQTTFDINRLLEAVYETYQ